MPDIGFRIVPYLFRRKESSSLFLTVYIRLRTIILALSGLSKKNAPIFHRFRHVLLMRHTQQSSWNSGWHGIASNAVVALSHWVIYHVLPHSFD